MGIVNKGVTVLHFDDTYQTQRKLMSIPHDDIHLSNLKGTRLFCDSHSLKIIEKKLSYRKQKGITLIGSGDFHYVTYLLLKEIKHPFALILFDHHTDLDDKAVQENMPISCGSWVSFALKDIPYLSKAILIGPKSCTAVNAANKTLHIIPYEPENHQVIVRLLANMKNEPVYISIDKDVLKREEAITNWDQGVMTVAALLFYLRIIRKETKVIGLDICGEAPKKMVSFSTLDNRGISRNEKINLKILKAFVNEHSLHETKHFA